MLKLIGDKGKSFIVNAIQKYSNAKIYVYYEDYIETIEGYQFNSNEYSVEQFCEFVYKNVNNLNNEFLPVNIIVIYTNLFDNEQIKIIEDCATKIELENIAGNVIITHK